MRKLARIYRVFFMSSLARELEFRANFFAKILQNIMWFGFFALIILVIYRNVKSVAGWSQMDTFLLGGTCYFVMACIQGFAASLLEVPEQVRRGTLDFVVTKPVDSQFWVSARRIQFDHIGNLLGSVTIIVYCAVNRTAPPDATQWLAYVVLVACALALFYSLNLIFMTCSLWWVKVDNLWVLSETAMEICRFPIDIFSAMVKRAFYVGVPLAFLAAAPTLQIIRGFDGRIVALGLLWSSVALIASRVFWRFALTRYSSASS
jgi:ABC-2 type transport system permease protein